MKQPALSVTRPVGQLAGRSLLLINPVVVYSVIWMGVLLFIHAGWAAMMSPVRPKFLLLVVGNIGISFVAYQVVRRWTSTRDSRLLRVRFSARFASASPFTQNALLRFCDGTFVLWVVGSAINVYTSRGLPILWVMSGDSRTYADFGLPTLSGFASASGLFASLGYFLLQLVGRTKRRWWAIALVFLYDCATINRGLVVWMLLELLGIYLQLGRFNIRRLFRAAVILAFLVIVFGAIGDFRTRRDQGFFLRMTATEEGQALFRHLPSGIWWTYMYSSVGAVNINASVEDVKPIGHPYWSVTYMFPTVLRLLLYPIEYAERYPLKMVNESANVFTLYGGFLADFGLTGCFAITALLQLVAGRYFIKARAGDIPSIIAYAVCVQVIVVSLFTDSFTGWLTLFQFFLAFMFRQYLKAKAIRGAEGVRRKRLVPALSEEPLHE